MPNRVLIVDDDLLGSRSLARLLVRMGWKVREASSAPDGLAALKEEPADLIVSDFAMPGDDGVTFLNDVMLAWPETTRVFYSGTVPNRRINDALTRGVALRHFTKGNDLEKLLGFIRERLGAPPPK